jgi:hypothetical protein
MLRFFAVFGFVLWLSACATPECKLDYPIREKAYKNDTIGLQAAINTAYAAYLKGCTDRSRDFNGPNSFQYCSIKAQDHVKNNIIFFLDQDEEPKTPSKLKVPLTPKTEP